ncbi:ExeA family protein [Atopomonas sediminilitoris]|uniref:ExeA family protein n=1 Tax=Atopomonas sediminilitoris TaxID=2919919 RepID=UPI001F4EC978|nr:AAA family ATPase [Atopomonas sediminilitoris]MCJ8168404.1 AAA family ATPase [Atopomonas sediminilitoris]
MYQGFYGLREMPFSLTPNTDFMVRLPGHQECLNLLLVALDQGEGFIKISGEVGTGKTLLCRALLNSLDAERLQLAYIPNPCLTPEGLRRALARELRITDAEQLGEIALLEAINQKLIELAQAGRGCVLLIDEAQALPDDTLEALRLLTNLETERSKLLQVVLFGQPELDVLLAREAFRQLRQRITFSYRLQQLDRAQVERYLSHRLAVAGYNGPALFDKAALKLLVQGTHGTPRLINIVAHKALMVGFGKGQRRIGKAFVQRALDDTEGVQNPTTQTTRPWPWAVAAVLLLAVGVWQAPSVLAWAEPWLAKSQQGGAHESGQ